MHPCHVANVGAERQGRPPGRDRSHAAKAPIAQKGALVKLVRNSRISHKVPDIL
jgi:hypothetical protein